MNNAYDDNYWNDQNQSQDAGGIYAESNNDPEWARDEPEKEKTPIKTATFETEKRNKKDRVIKKQGSVTETETSVSVDKKTCCGYTTERWKKFGCIWFWLIVVIVIGGVLLSLGVATLPGVAMLLGGLLALGCSIYCFRSC